LTIAGLANDVAVGVNAFKYPKDYSKKQNATAVAVIVGGKTTKVAGIFQQQAKAVATPSPRLAPTSPYPPSPSSPPSRGASASRPPRPRRSKCEVWAERLSMVGGCGDEGGCARTSLLAFG